MKEYTIEVSKVVVDRCFVTVKADSLDKAIAELKEKPELLNDVYWEIDMASVNSSDEFDYRDASED